ncbi:MAG: hypothetical protein JNJ88_10985 [Planctomycetes bacterium]|nr:hypothetical protein [Planctomycetota bacterium]
MAELALPTNQIHEFVSLLKREKWSIVLPGLAGLAIGLFVLGFVPRRYEAWTRVELREIKFDDDATGRLSQIAPYQKDVQQVGAQVLANIRLDKAIGDKLRWQSYLTVRGTPKSVEYLDKVRERTKVERAKKDRDTGADYVTITYRDEDPVRAADFANTIRDVWAEESIAAYKDQVNREYNDERRKTERASDRLLTARRAVDTWQRQHEISPTQPIGRGATIEEDFIIQQYRKDESEKVALETDVATLQQRYESVVAAWTSEPRTFEEEIVPEKPSGPAQPVSTGDPVRDALTKIQNEIAAKELELKSSNLKAGNKLYQRKQSEIDLLKKQEKALAAKVTTPKVDPTTGLPTAANRRVVLNQKKIDLQAEVDRAETELNAAKARLLVVTQRLAKRQPEFEKRSEVYAKYNALKTDEEVAEKQYKDAQERLTLKQNLLLRISDPAGNPFRIFDEARPAEKPVEPNVPLMLMIAAVAGFGLGLAIVVAREFLKGSFRSTDDAAGSLSIPVLGSVHKMVTRRELLRAKAKRATGLSVSLAAILFIALVGGLYLFQPKVLPKGMRSTFDSVKEAFR